MWGNCLGGVDDVPAASRLPCIGLEGCGLACLIPCVMWDVGLYPARYDFDGFVMADLWASGFLGAPEPGLAEDITTLRSWVWFFVTAK